MTRDEARRVERAAAEGKLAFYQSGWRDGFSAGLVLAVLVWALWHVVRGGAA